MTSCLAKSNSLQLEKSHPQEKEGILQNVSLKGEEKTKLQKKQGGSKDD